MKIKIAELKKKVLSTLETNFTTEEAHSIADYLLWADMSGNRTQGIIKLTGTEPLHTIKQKHPIKIERETKLSQLINAGANNAILVCLKATDIAIAKAKEYGFGIVGVHNTYSSNGAQAYYVEKMTKKDLIGVMCSRTPAATTAFNSVDPLFGTNPIAFGFPTKETSLVFDMATSAMTWYGLVLAKIRGKKIPANVAIDKMGKPTRNPEEAMNGALLSFDRDYKGAGISMIIEILAGPLASSSWIDNKTFKEEWGSLFIAIDPNLLVDVEDFKANCSDLIHKIKNSRKKQGVKEIRLPGEQSRKNYEASLNSGLVDVDEEILKELNYV